MKLTREDALVLAKVLFASTSVPVSEDGYHHLQLFKKRLDDFLLSEHTDTDR
jgi:hypothetical protein